MLYRDLIPGTKGPVSRTGMQLILRMNLKLPRVVFMNNSGAVWYCAHTRKKIWDMIIHWMESGSSSTRLKEFILKPFMEGKDSFLIMVPALYAGLMAKFF